MICQLSLLGIGLKTKTQKSLKILFFGGGAYKVQIHVDLFSDDHYLNFFSVRSEINKN